jgi:hypothetical protein
MSIFRQAVNIPTVASSVGAIGSYTGATATGNLTLNGARVSVDGTIKFSLMGFASSVTITKGGGISLANITFTITGIFAGNLIVESILGPANNTSVTTNNLFETIIGINIGASTVQTFTIDSNVNTAVMLIGNNPVAAKLPKSNTYSILLNSRAAAGNWAAGSAIIYGVADTAPTLLQANALVNITTYNNFYALFGASAVITQAQLNSGVITQTTYPFAAVIVYLAAGINTTPAFIEITQS